MNYLEIMGIENKFNVEITQELTVSVLTGLNRHTENTLELSIEQATTLIKAITNYMYCIKETIGFIIICKRSVYFTKEYIQETDYRINKTITLAIPVEQVESFIENLNDVVKKAKELLKTEEDLQFQKDCKEGKFN